MDDFAFPPGPMNLEPQRWQHLLPRPLRTPFLGTVAEKASQLSKPSPDGTVRTAAPATAGTAPSFQRGSVLVAEAAGKPAAAGREDAVLLHPCISRNDAATRVPRAPNASSCVHQDGLHSMLTSHGDCSTRQSEIFSAAAQDFTGPAAPHQGSRSHGRAGEESTPAVHEACTNPQESSSEACSDSLARLASLLHQLHLDVRDLQEPDGPSGCSSPLGVSKLAQLLDISPATLHETLHRPGLVATSAADEWAAALSKTPAFAHMPDRLLKALLECFHFVSLSPGAVLVDAHTPVGATFVILAGNVVQISEGPGLSRNIQQAQGDRSSVPEHSELHAGVAKSAQHEVEGCADAEGSGSIDFGPGWVIGSLHMVSGLPAELGLQAASFTVTPTLALALKKGDFQACLWRAGIRTLLASLALGTLLRELRPVEIEKTLEHVGLLQVSASSPLCVEATPVRAVTVLIQGSAVVCCRKERGPYQSPGESCTRGQEEQELQSGHRADRRCQRHGNSASGDRVHEGHLVGGSNASDVYMGSGQAAALRRGMAHMNMSWIASAQPGCLLGAEHLTMSWLGQAFPHDRARGATSTRASDAVISSGHAACCSVHKTSAVMATAGWVLLVDVMGFVQEILHHAALRDLQTALGTAMLAKRATQYTEAQVRRRRSSLQRAVEQRHAHASAASGQPIISTGKACSTPGAAAVQELRQHACAATPVALPANRPSESHPTMEGMLCTEEAGGGLAWEDVVVVLSCLARSPESRLAKDVDDACRGLSALEELGCVLDIIASD